MTESRVEAVREALLWARDRGLDPHDKRMAQAAIEANDAWLKEHEWSPLEEANGNPSEIEIFFGGDRFIARQTGYGGYWEICAGKDSYRMPAYDHEVMSKAGAVFRTISNPPEEPDR